MISSIETVLLIIFVVYLLVGNILWVIGLQAMGGEEGYERYLEENDLKHVPLWIIFLAYLIVWPFFVRRI